MRCVVEVARRRARAQSTAPIRARKASAKLGMRELRVLWPHLRPHLRLALGAVACSIVAQAAALAAPILIRYGIDKGIRARTPRDAARRRCAAPRRPRSSTGSRSATR